MLIQVLEWILLIAHVYIGLLVVVLLLSVLWAGVAIAWAILNEWWIKRGSKRR